MDFLSRLMVALACVALVASYRRMGFTGGIMAIATCGVLAAGAVFQRRNRLPHLTANIPAEVGQATELNESVFELYSPSGKPSMEVLFFHGFQDGDYQNAHITAWKCGDGSAIWPQTWLVEEFPDARILCVSYDSRLITSSENRMIDMDIISENLLSNLLSAKIGQAPCCPVILVGHSFGGLVIKHMCVFASRMIDGLKRNSDRSVLISTFLGSVRGMFFYSTPHQGVLDRVGEHFLPEGPLLEYVKNLSTPGARVHSNFGNLCGQNGQYKMWQIAGLGEGRRTKQRWFNEVVVSEASARYGSFNVVPGADHITVCRPMKKTCGSFLALVDFLKGVADHSKAMVYGLPDNPTALERRAFEVLEILKSSPVLGIVGMGGIGKTTIAKKLFENIYPEFEYACFVDNVKSIPGYELNDRILNQFRRNGNRVDPNSLQWSDLRQMKILVMMDDPDSEKQLRTLPPLNELGDGSRLIFTTRDRGVWSTTPKCGIYEVDFLNSDDANSLFCQQAFGQERIPDRLIEINNHLEENVKKLVEKCGGLPLSLELLGSYLRCNEDNATLWNGDKTNDIVWKQTLDKVGSAQQVNGVRTGGMWDSLTLSYDGLLPEEQGMFIEAGIYFFEQPVERALAAWSTAYGYSETRWANLLRTSMVKEVYRTVWDNDSRSRIKYKEVWVHEHLRDLAKKISGGVMLFSSLETHLNTNEVCAQTSIVRLGSESSPSSEGQEQFPVELLDKLENLKYLELFGVFPTGSSRNLLQKLSVLTWRLPWNYRKLFPISLEHMKNLAVLELENWQIQEESWLETLGSLRELRVLSLSNVIGPARPPENSGPVRLPESFCCLSKLKRLKLQDMELTALPESFGRLSVLEYFVLSGCQQLKELPESFGKLSSLATLVIRKCSRLANLPHSFGRLSSLVQCRIESCDELKWLQPPEVRQVDSRANLPSGTHQSSVDFLENLPASFAYLPSLEVLDVMHCAQLKALPENLGQCHALKRLYIDNADDLEALPDSCGNLAALTDLTLDRLRSLERLPVSLGNLSALQELTISRCVRLQRLPDNFGQLTALQQLTLEGGELDELPDEFGKLRSLKRLFLSSLGLERLPVSLGNLSALQELNIWCCHRLQRLPDNFGQLTALQNLALVGDELGELHDEFGKLRSLKCLFLSCPRLERLPDTISRLSSLQGLDLVNCEKLRRLPNNFGELRALKRLAIIRAGSLEALPYSLWNLSSLEELTISETTSSLWGTTSLQESPQSIGQLQTLRKLKIIGLQLRSLPEELGSLPSLEVLHIDRCPNIRSLPDSLGRMSSLRKVWIGDCSGLTSLPDRLGRRVWRDGDGDAGTSADGESPNKSSSEGLLLFIRRCPGLDVSMLRGFTRVHPFGFVRNWDVFRLGTEKSGLEG